MRTLCVGHVTYDITFPADSYPKENTKVRYYEKSECVGGPASIAALLLGKWGQTVDMAGLAGNDDYGNKIKNEFSKNRVGTQYVSLSDEVETSHSLILANKESGTRTILMYVPKHVQMVPFKLIETPDIILVDGHEHIASKKLLEMYPNAISILDAGRDKSEVVELARMVKYLVCSKDFAEKVTGIKFDLDNRKTFADIYSKMEAMFKNIIVITLEAMGCMYRENGQIRIMPSIKVKTIDSTGAGDIFHGAFAYGIAKGFDFEKTLKFANIAGALSVTRMGGYKSIPSLEEMQEVYDQVK